MAIYIPSKLRVGFINREGTYTGKLAYIIYYDETGKLRKERSFDNWRDKRFETVELDNVPTSGFVLNKKVGGYAGDWGNFRQAYVRVYDPRDFEFEITIPNLVFILESCASTVGKGLEGEFVYAWDGTELVLLPLSSPDYQRLAKDSKAMEEPLGIRKKDLIVGATYVTKKLENLTYMGYHDRYSYNGSLDAKKFWFYNGSHFIWRASVPTIIRVASSGPHENFADMFEKLKRNEYFSPINKEEFGMLRYTWEEFLAEAAGNTTLYFRPALYPLAEPYMHSRTGDTLENSNSIFVSLYRYYSGYYRRDYLDQPIHMDHFPIELTKDREFTSLREVFDTYSPVALVQYLMNGEVFSMGSKFIQESALESRVERIDKYGRKRQDD